MLRHPSSARTLGLGLALLLLVGVLCAVLVRNGNPGNMGVCGACFLRDAAGSLGLVAPPVREKVAYLRPEIAGLVLGAFLLALARRRFTARSGTHAGSRFVLGLFMGIGALVFLGCPFRMLQRLGAGDLNAVAGLAGFVPGVLVGLLLERRGYGLGKSSEVPAPVGLQGPAMVGILVALALSGALFGPVPGEGGAGPARAPFLLSLAVGAVAGAALSATGFCAVLAARQIVLPQKGVLLGAVAIVVGYGLVLAASGAWKGGSADQPIAHTDGLWNAISMALVGLTGVLAGGCPVRQLVMVGEGHADALVTCGGILVGGAIAHDLGLASSAAGPTAAGTWAVVLGLAWALAYGIAMTPWRRAGAGDAP
jgi:YedE family putative selenium metabolism protein